MALEVDVPMLDNEYVGAIQTDANGMFIAPSDQQITGGDLLSLVDYHRQNVRPHYVKAQKYYKGDHQILHLRSKASYKPDNRLVINFPKKIVNSFNGFFIGTPVKIDSKEDTVDKFVDQWKNINNFEDISSEVAKMSSMYGHAFFYVYQDETGQPCVVQASPLNTFVIYDDSLAHRPMYGVQYRYDWQRRLIITLIDKTVQRTLTVNQTSGSFLDQIAAIANPYPIIPIIEADENAERMALCDDIISIIDGIDKVMSEKSNDVDYFADAYLKIINASVSDEARKEMRDNRVINAIGEDASSAQVDFMAKPDADGTQEHLIDRLVDYIYQIAEVTNINDQAFAGNPSGVSLKLKYQPMSDMAKTKSAKFKTALRQVFQCVFAVSKVPDDSWQQLEFTFTQAIPENTLEEAQVFNYIFGKVSDKTAFSRLSFIKDPEKEIEQIKAERGEDQQLTADIVKQQLKGGVANDNGSTAEDKNSTVDQSGQPDVSGNR